jgi:hypothetical protein
VVELEEVTSRASRETVETVFECSRLWVTGLKPGVNEMGRFQTLRQGQAEAKSHESHYKLIARAVPLMILIVLASHAQQHFTRH